MARGRGVHVVRSGKGWAVKSGGRTRSSHRTQGNAAKAGRSVAKHGKTELYIHGRDGRIREANSYGNENDDEGYSADIRHPDKPRSVLKDGDPIPPELAAAEVRRLAELFERVRRGPSLRFVVDKDAETMIRYAYWTSRLLGRI